MPKGTKPGAKFTRVDDVIRQALKDQCQPSMSAFSRETRISFDTLDQIIRRQTKWISDDILERAGIFSQFADRPWLTKKEAGLGGKRKMPLRQGRRGLEKRCNCPLHNGAYVPLTNFNFHKNGWRAGKPFHQCRDGNYRARKASSWNGQSGFIPAGKVQFAWLELVRRLGPTEAARRCGFHPNFNVRFKSQRVVRKRTAQRIFKVLAEVRANNEVRHAKSIRRGSAFRGEEERIPKRAHEFYYTLTDEEAERRREKQDAA